MHARVTVSARSAGVPAVARAASSVALIRDGSTGGVEVLMVQRASGSSFAPNALAFPGGTVDRGDASSLTDRFALDALASAMGLDSSADALAGARAHIVAAIRELLEECGILLARSIGGVPLSEADRALIETIRAEVLHGATLAEATARHNVLPHVDDLVYAARFMTPTDRPRRFDARFFLAPAPAQEHRFHAAEISSGGWVRPLTVLEDQHVMLMPPTRVFCNELARHLTAVDAMEALRRSPLAFVPKGVV